MSRLPVSKPEFLTQTLEIPTWNFSCRTPVSKLSALNPQNAVSDSGKLSGSFDVFYYISADALRQAPVPPATMSSPTGRTCCHAGAGCKIRAVFSSTSIASSAMITASNGGLTGSPVSTTAKSLPRVSVSGLFSRARGGGGNDGNPVHRGCVEQRGIESREHGVACNAAQGIFGSDFFKARGKSQRGKIFLPRFFNGNIAQIQIAFGGHRFGFSFMADCTITASSFFTFCKNCYKPLTRFAPLKRVEPHFQLG
ncbi:MAG: hypothetical protein Pg6C_18480 [Treponemataceae bacterium]|nr:MAG: hypothetical protein Pg6C_18480 [Treponemataceae bacterium]